MPKLGSCRVNLSASCSLGWDLMLERPRDMTYTQSIIKIILPVDCLLSPNPLFKGVSKPSQRKMPKDFFWDSCQKSPKESIQNVHQYSSLGFSYSEYCDMCQHVAGVCSADHGLGLRAQEPGYSLRVGMCSLKKPEFPLLCGSRASARLLEIFTKESFRQKEVCT